jgi:O-methyltransferase
MGISIGPTTTVLDVGCGDGPWEFKRAFFWNAFKALEFNGISGDYAEFGSHGARTFRLAWDQIQQRRPERHLWAFDSFCGLPAGTTSGDPHPKWTAGAMATDLAIFRQICHSHGIGATDYTVVEGFYEQSLANLAPDSAPKDIALAYVDCDLHSSTRAVLNFLLPRLKPGMIIGFDDYFCWSKDQISGERRALLEFISDATRWHFERYRDFGWTGTSFVVEHLDPELAAAQRLTR